MRPPGPRIWNVVIWRHKQYQPFALQTVPVWRQEKHLPKKIKKLVQSVGRIAASKSTKKKDVLESLYGDLLQRTGQLLGRAKSLIQTARGESQRIDVLLKITALEHWINLTQQVCDTARRRVLLGESVPNCEKLFSMFESHTQLYRRGKAGQPNQYGRLVLVYEDDAGFISHYHLMDRTAQDQEVVVEQTNVAQRSMAVKSVPHRSIVVFTLMRMKISCMESLTKFVFYHVIPVSMLSV
ncbi:hypothetical protein [Novipirellula artificiosorum]|uniref:Uncharacterized protein n=1 Tax=Novipirellula artificiosorum TaxID=2528016 RepID=A0A5C6D3E1_9BACT|nr:hypothetical protein [Novipirellula artificiosorum]TWU31310.1 hypothetical protein Poly41_61790 [Novipirellula artificiosorum]